MYPERLNGDCNNRHPLLRGVCWHPGRQASFPLPEPRSRLATRHLFRPKPLFKRVDDGKRLALQEKRREEGAPWRQGNGGGGLKWNSQTSITNVAHPYKCQPLSLLLMSIHARAQAMICHVTLLARYHEK